MPTLHEILNEDIPWSAEKSFYNGPNVWFVEPVRYDPGESIVHVVRPYTACAYSERYNGVRKPTCGCDACKAIYLRAKLTAIAHNDFFDDPILIRRTAENMLEVLGS